MNDGDGPRGEWVCGLIVLTLFALVLLWFLSPWQAH